MIVKRSKNEPPGKPKLVNSYPFWSPRFWNGMRVGDYTRLLFANRFRIHPLRIPMLMLVFGCTWINSSFAALQTLFYSRRIRRTELTKPPVFVIGHWRSGTTFLHELLSQDERFGFSSTYDCFLPHHFLVSRRILSPIMRLIMPHQRPMDNMATGIDYPQEDEFALCGLHCPTPYLRIAFCNGPPPHIDLLNFHDSDPGIVAKVKQAFTGFYQALTLRDRKQLILKSPTHTGRIATLAKWFPGAKFIHISRHPYKVIPSTIRLWQTLDRVQSFQIPKYTKTQLTDYVFDCFDQMYAGYFAAADSLKSNQLVEIRYEDLVSNPMDVARLIYSQLELEDFSECSSAIEDFVASRKDYRPTTSSIEPSLREQIDQRCFSYVERFGYDICEPESVPSEDFQPVAK